MAIAATPYSYGIRNRYRPTSLIPNAYGWSSNSHYTRADVPTGLVDRPGSMTDIDLLQNFSYEWFESNQLGGNRNLSNPPFVSGAAGRLHPALRDSETGNRARILRGYIRRAQSEVGDEKSKARLYFMYNPETITRDYVSYLNQSALDPFNSVYESGNLVAPPSFMDFSFSLFFDRQEEAQQAEHPGVFVDYQFFDLVVRNVVPTNPNQSSATLPDNGVMMVNPRDITVVFSPQLSVQGRPLNAQVSFEKFTHRMTPTRMTIQLQMRVIYMGPPRDAIEYKAEELQAEAAIPWGAGSPDFGQSFDETQTATDSWWKGAGGDAESDSTVTGTGSDIPIGETMGTIAAGNDQLRIAALNWARLVVRQGKGPGFTRYVGATSPYRHSLPDACDCSGLITEAYRQVSMVGAKEMGFDTWPGTGVMLDNIAKNKTKQVFRELKSFDYRKLLWPGDLLLRQNHIMFFSHYEGNNIKTFDAASASSNPEVGEHTFTSIDDYKWYQFRPTPFGGTAGLSGTDVNLSLSTGQYVPGRTKS